MSDIKWMLKGREFLNCNCAYGCPCQFNALPTYGDCKGVLGFDIDHGYHGDTKLDGLKFVGICSWPKAIHQGHGEVQPIVDERASPQQREAILRIMSGLDTEPGVTIFQVFAATFDKVHDPIFAKIDFSLDVDGRRATLKVPGIIETRAEPIKNPVTEQEHRACISLPRGFEYTVAEVGRGWTNTSGAIALKLLDSTCALCAPAHDAERSDTLKRKTGMNSSFEAVLQRDRAIVLAALATITMLAWADIVWLAGDMAMDGMDMTGFRMIPAGQGLMMPANAPWQPLEFAYVFAMWVVMMIGMMTPSAAPMILIYARVGRQAVSSGHPFAASGWFASGYLIAWLGFSLAATSAQWALERAALLTPMMESASAVLGGTVLIVAGIYQWTPVKEACLSYCQAPLTFIMRHGGFRSDASGALALGLRHGVYCIGCCWALMLLLFVGGVMNVLWIAALAALVLLEKALPFGKFVSRIFGCVFIAGGAWFLLQM